MANTYTRLLIHLVFVVRRRQSLVVENIREPLEKYMTGIVQKNGHKLLAIYCMPDHSHVFIGLNPKQSLSDLVRDVKANSSKWINDGKLTRFKFQWQVGYGAFSYAKAQQETVINYIRNQPIHHKKKALARSF